MKLKHIHTHTEPYTNIPTSQFEPDDDGRKVRKEVGLWGDDGGGRNAAKLYLCIFPYCW